MVTENVDVFTPIMFSFSFCFVLCRAVPYRFCTTYDRQVVRTSEDESASPLEIRPELLSGPPMVKTRRLRFASWKTTKTQHGSGGVLYQSSHW